MAGSARTFNPNVKGEVELREQLQRIALMLPLSSYDWTGTAPGATDDISKGWKVGSKIIVGTNAAARAIDPTLPANTIYECSNNTENAAVWQQMTGTHPTSGGAASLADLDGITDYIGVVDVSQGKIVRVTLNELVAATPGGRTVVDGKGTYANNAIAAQVGLDVKMGFNVPFFSLDTPVAIL